MQTRSSNAIRIPVTSAAATTQLLAARPGRNGFRVHNASSAILYLSYGAGGTNTDYSVAIAAGGSYEDPFRFTGIVTGYWASANGAALMTELY